MQAGVPDIGGHYEPPPSIAEAKAAWEDIKNILQPRRKTGRGHLPFKGDEGLRRRLGQMRMFLYKYSHGMMGWTTASIDTAREMEGSTYIARKIREWSRAFIGNRRALPHSRLINGYWNASLLDQSFQIWKESGQEERKYCSRVRGTNRNA